MPRELFPEFSEPRVVGYQHQPPGRVEQAHRVGQSVRHEGGPGMVRADLVLHDAVDDAVAQLGPQGHGGILVDRTHLPLPAVGALEAQRRRLLAAALLLGLEAAGDPGEIEDLDLDRRCPQLAVVGTPEGGEDGTGLVLRARHRRSRGAEAAHRPGSFAGGTE